MSHDAVLGRELGCQFGHGDVAILLYPTDQDRGIRRQFSAAWRSALTRGSTEPVADIRCATRTLVLGLTP